MNPEETEEIKRYVGVVAEGPPHDIQQVAEGHELVLTQVKEFGKEVREEFGEAGAGITFSFAEPDQDSDSWSDSGSGLALMHFLFLLDDRKVHYRKAWNYRTRNTSTVPAVLSPDQSASITFPKTF